MVVILSVYLSVTMLLLYLIYILKMRVLYVIFSRFATCGFHSKMLC